MPRSCEGTNKDGSPCQAPTALVDQKSGFCRTHDPSQPDSQSEAGKAGARALWKRLKAGEELGELHTHEDAKRWLEVIGRMVVSGALKASAGNTLVKVVSEWVRTEKDRLEVVELEELKEKVEQLKETLKPRAVR